MKMLNSVHDLYIELIKDIYHAEVLLISELQFFIPQSSSQRFTNILRHHLTTVRIHTARLEEILKAIDADMLQEHSRAMKSMSMETKKPMDRHNITHHVMVEALHRITNAMSTTYQLLISMANELTFSEQKRILKKQLEEVVHFDNQINSCGFSIPFNNLNLQQKLS
ncbi:MAG: DUF892 family protein [Fodinibius sp.]|nr:DUF892 family protein [Fodinibius sp.]